MGSIRSSWAVSSRHEDGDADGGFTLIEAMAAAAIIAIVLAGLGSFFIGTMTTARDQGQRQTAVRLATDGLDVTRAAEVAALLDGRILCGDCREPVAQAVPLLAGTQRWDVSPGWNSAGTMGDRDIGRRRLSAAPLPR
jgi:prepilin-type N-terminal cleavage/methylation domain-containing protein